MVRAWALLRAIEVAPVSTRNLIGRPLTLPLATYCPALSVSCFAISQGQVYIRSMQVQ